MRRVGRTGARHRLLSVLLGFLLLAPLKSGAATELPDPLILRGAAVIDGTGAPALENGVVVVEDGLVRCVGPSGECSEPPGARSVDLEGQWIIPGLVDAHVHFSQSGWVDGRPDALDLRADHPYAQAVARLRLHPEPFFRSYLCSGVTSVFDVGGFPWTWDLRDRTLHRTDAPRIAAAGPLLSTRDHWLNLPGERQFLHMRDRDAVREATDYLLATGTDAVKVWYLAVEGEEAGARQREYLALAGRWARDAGVPLIVHATSLEGAKEALEAGATLLVHSVEDELVDGEFLSLARRTGAIYTPTLTVYEGYGELRARRFDETRTEAACVDPLTLELARSTAVRPGAPDSVEAAALEAAAAERWERMAENLRRVHRAGIPVALGTDAGNPLTLHGAAIFRELEAFQEAGLQPMEILIAATAHGALAMGMSEITGTISPGKSADLLVLTRDPLEDIAHLREIRYVIRGGELHSRSDLVFTDD